MFNTTDIGALGQKVTPIRGKVILYVADVIFDSDIYSIICDYLADYGDYLIPLPRFYDKVTGALAAYNETVEEFEQKPIPTRAEFNNAMMDLGDRMKFNPNKVLLLRF